MAPETVSTPTTLATVGSHAIAVVTSDVCVAWARVALVARAVPAASPEPTRCAIFLRNTRFVVGTHSVTVSRGGD